jgi:hypothetical protein
VVSQLPAATGADDGDACVLVDAGTGRTAVYIFDESAGNWERSIATFAVGARIDRASASADVTIDGVEHEDVPVVTRLPAEHTQGTDTLVIRDILGRETVYNWDAESSAWERVAAAPEMGNVYQRFTVELPGGNFTGRAQVVASTSEITRPMPGQVVAVTGTDGNVASLQRYVNGEWVTIHEFKAAATTPPATPPAGTGSGAGAGAGTTPPLVEPVLTEAQLGAMIRTGRVRGLGREVVTLSEYANYSIVRINLDGGTPDVSIYQRTGETTADVYFSGRISLRYASTEDVSVVTALPATHAAGQDMVIYHNNLFVWKDNRWIAIAGV